MSEPAAFLVDGAEVAARLGVDPEVGLPAAEVAARQERYGPNELRAVPPEPWWRRILAQFQDPLVYLLLVAIVISVAVWVIEGADGVPIDAVVIGAILILNAVLGYVEAAKAADAVAALASLTAAGSSVLRDGEVVAVPTAALVPGDVLVLAEGDAVGADARLVSAAGLKVQEAALTGESEATVKDPAPLSGDVVLGDRTNLVHKGTSVVEGVGRAVVIATGMDTEMGAIADMLERTEAAPSPLEVEIERVSKTLGVLVIGIAVVVMATLLLRYGVHDAEELAAILLLGVSLAVAAVPEGLPAILSLVLAIGVRAMADRQAVMKELHAVETLGAASVVCSDKTGTLTRNEMTMRTIVTASGRVELSGTGYDPTGQATITGDEDRALTEARVTLIGGAVANNAVLRQTDAGWEIHGDPTEAAFLVAQHKLSEVPDRVAGYERRGEIPFTSDRKLMSVVSHHHGRDEDRLFTKGAPDVLLDRCVAERVGDEVVPLDEDGRRRVRNAIEELSAAGYRTLGVAYRVGDGADPVAPEVDAERDLVLVGVVGIIDPPRDEAREAVAEARRAGVRTVMITGDHPTTAGRIASDLGIVAPGSRVVTGAELHAMDAAALSDTAREVSVYARVAPEHKLDIVDALQAQGHVVAMTGDGVNDAPALKSADIGIAMGITGTEVSKGASRMILGDDNFATIIAAIRQGRVIYDNISKFLRYLLSSNMGEVATVFLGIVGAGILGLTGAGGGGDLVVPLLATQILWINLVTDSGPALAMGVDPEIDDVMTRPPRPTTQRMLDRAMWTRVAWVGLVMGLITLLTIDLHLPGGLIEGHRSLEVARTTGFTTLVLAQLFNALNARSMNGSAFHRLWVNPWLWASLALGAALQVAVVHVPFLQHAFGTAGLTLGEWATCAAMASVVLWAVELVKLVQRRRARAGAQATPAGPLPSAA